MSVELSEEQIRALLAILDQTVFRGSELPQIAALYAALHEAIHE
jgi:uncharacterized protein (DUF1778 family)